eukprot:1484939-Pyramimonas_sp.AAC.1
MQRPMSAAGMRPGTSASGSSRESTQTLYWRIRRQQSMSAEFDGTGPASEGRSTREFFVLRAASYVLADRRTTCLFIPMCWPIGGSPA